MVVNCIAMHVNMHVQATWRVNDKSVTSHKDGIDLYNESFCIILD